LEKVKKKILVVTVDFEGELIRDLLRDEYITIISKGSPTAHREAETAKAHRG